MTKIKIIVNTRLSFFRSRAKKKKVESVLDEQYMSLLKENQQFAKEIHRLTNENIALKVS